MGALDKKRCIGNKKHCYLEMGYIGLWKKYIAIAIATANHSLGIIVVHDTAPRNLRTMKPPLGIKMRVLVQENGAGKDGHSSKKEASGS